MKTDKEIFYKFIKRKGYVEDFGNKVMIEGYDCYLSELENEFIITEARSGLILGIGLTKKESIIEAIRNANEFGTGDIIEKHIKKHGLSPISNKVDLLA